MAGCQETKAFLLDEETTFSESSQTSRSQNYEEETFYRNCRAAYLAVFKSSLEKIKSKEQLTLALQQAGRNPSQKTVNKYWTLQTTTLNFDDFCSLLKKEEPVEETDLLKAFSKLDPNNNGHILHSELHKILTSRGEKMTADEINKIIELAEVNNDGRFDYHKFCKLYMTTSEQCLKNAIKNLETDSKLKRRQFGNQMETSSELATSPISKTLPKIAKKVESRPVLKRGSWKTSLQYSSAPSGQPCVCFNIIMDVSSNRNSKLTEAHAGKEWHCAQSKGCFFLQDDGEIISHRYKMVLPQRSAICITIKPVNLHQRGGKFSPWLAVDTALFICKKNEVEEDLELVSFTELQNKEVFGWKGELRAGTYWVIPFTTGCRFKKAKKQASGEAKLVCRQENGDLVLTKEFREALLEIFEMIDLDENGFLSLEEYNFFEMRTSGEKCDEEAWDVCKENFDMKNNELTKQGFMDVNLIEATGQGGDHSGLWVILQAMGYNKSLELTEACPFSVHICAEKCKPQIKPACMEAGGEHLKNLTCMSVINKGDAKPMDSCESLIVHTYKSDMRISSVIENKSKNRAIIHVDGKQSKNCVNNRGLSTFAVEVAPKSMMICQHVVPVNEQEEWIYSYVYSVLP